MKRINNIELDQNFWTTFQADSIDDLLAIAMQFGQIIPSRKNSNDLFDTLTIKSKNQVDTKSLSAIHGDKQFPFHTDGAYLGEPPKYVILRSPKTIENCPTLLCNPKFSKTEKKNISEKCVVSKWR